MSPARGPFGAAEAALVGQDLCAALAAVHAAGLLHRDVKAQNVMRESGGRIVLMDFGPARSSADTAEPARMAGTPLYLAPEMFRGSQPRSQSDIYSLGVLLFYLVTGEFPVAAASIESSRVPTRTNSAAGCGISGRICRGVRAGRRARARSGSGRTLSHRR